jgi:hypothetical protein
VLENQLNPIRVRENLHERYEPRAQRDSDRRHAVHRERRPSFPPERLSLTNYACNAVQWFSERASVLARQTETSLEKLDVRRRYFPKQPVDNLLLIAACCEAAMKSLELECESRIRRKELPCF